MLILISDAFDAELPKRLKPWRGDRRQGASSGS